LYSVKNSPDPRVIVAKSIVIKSNPRNGPKTVQAQFAVRRKATLLFAWIKLELVFTRVPLF
jgi:hypothetical protein